MQLVCKKCGYAWEYAGNKHRTSCSKCKTSITVYKLGAIGVREMIKNTAPEIKPLRLSITLLDSLAFNRAKAWAKTNGEDYITLKPNSEGILSL